MISRKTEIYKYKIAACDGDKKRLFSVFDGLLGRRGNVVVPTSGCDLDLASDFASFLTQK